MKVIRRLFMLGFAGLALARPAYSEEAPAATSPATPPGAAAADSAVESLRRELQALKAQMEALQKQLDALTQAGAAAQASAAAAAAPPTAAPPPPAMTPVPAPPPPVAVAGPTKAPGLLNPAISGVFQLIGNSSLTERQDANGFDLSEAEVAFESVVDPYAKMNLYLTFPADASPEVEEGYVTTLTLPGALQLKGGRFKSAFGKWNTLHTHAFFTVERPDALVNFFGEESLTNDGLSLSWLIPNPAGIYIDSTSEVGTARPSDSFNSVERALTWSERLGFFFNAGDSDTIELGLSAAGGQTGPSQALIADVAANAPGLQPDGRLPSNVYGADVTWKWKPLQRNTYHAFLWQNEALFSARQVQTLTPAATFDQERITSGGGYTYLEGQWTKRWKVGVRYDLTGFPDSTIDREWAASAVVKFIPSEFQEIRFEVKHTRLNESAALRFDSDQDDTRVFFEWIPVIGAHGAHKY